MARSVSDDARSARSGLICVFLLKDFEGFAGFAKDVVLPGYELRSEIGFLALVHERLVFGGYVVHFNDVVHRLTPQPVVLRAYIFGDLKPHKTKALASHAFVTIRVIA